MEKCSKPCELVDWMQELIVPCILMLLFWGFLRGIWFYYQSCAFEIFVKVELRKCFWETSISPLETILCAFIQGVPQGGTRWWELLSKENVLRKIKLKVVVSKWNRASLNYSDLLNRFCYHLRTEKDLR